MWLYIRIQCPLAKIELAFEVKVSRSAFVHQIRKGIFEYICQLLQEKGKTEEYTLSDLHMNRSLAGRRQSSPKHSEERTMPLEDSMPISTVFDFTAGSVVGTLERGAEPIVKDAEVTREHEESRMRLPEDILKRTLSVRKIQIKQIEQVRPEPARRESEPAQTNRRCGGCVLC